MYVSMTPRSPFHGGQLGIQPQVGKQQYHARAGSQTMSAAQPAPRSSSAAPPTRRPIPMRQDVRNHPAVPDARYDLQDRPAAGPGDLRE